MAEGGEPIDTEEWTSTEEALSAISCFINFILTLTLTIFHGTKFYSDLYTEERTVVAYRPKPPKITSGYKRMAILTIVSICSYLLILTMEVIQFNFAVGVCNDTYLLFSMLDKFGFWMAKCTLYTIFILRLHEVYGTSAYGYSARNLKCVGILVIIFCIFMLFIMIFFTLTQTVYIDDTDTVYPWFCQIIFKLEFLQLVAGLMILFDVIGSITSMICFIIPLNRVIKAAANINQTNESQKETLNKMMSAGVKYKICVLVAACSTLSWVFILLVGFAGVATFLGQCDYFINPLCLALMTPYYPSDIYYERLCFLCLWCCDRKGIYRSKASDKHDDEAETNRNTDIDSTVVQSSINPTETDTDTKTGPSVDTTVTIQTKAESSKMFKATHLL